MVSGNTVEKLYFYYAYNSNQRRKYIVVDILHGKDFFLIQGLRYNKIEHALGIIIPRICC